MKNTILQRKSILCAAAALALATACNTDNDNKYIVKTGDIYIVAGAYTGTSTKVQYEYDETESLHRTIWSEFEELYVAAYSEDQRVNADGTLWSRFATESTEAGYNKDYMLFSGSALTSSDSEIAANQRLFALYPATVLCSDEDDLITVPCSQKYYPETFDPNSVIMVSAPLKVTLPSEGTAHTSAFRFRHHTGYLKLSFNGLPEAAADEYITSVTLSASEGTPVAGNFRAVIDNHLGDWTFEPDSDTFDTISLDFTESETKVSDLEECWFVMMPGDYDDVTISIHTDKLSEITMHRSGLTIESNVIHAQNITFNDSDQVKQIFTIMLTGEDLNIPKSLPLGGKEITGEKDGVTFTHKRTDYTLIDKEKYIQLESLSSGIGGQLWNSSPLPSPLISVEIHYYSTELLKSKFVYTKTGTSLTDYSQEIAGTGDEIVMVYPENSDSRYFHIENKGDRAVSIQYIKITCAPN